MEIKDSRLNIDIVKKIFFLLFVAVVALCHPVNAQRRYFLPSDNPNEIYLQYGDPGLVWGLVTPAGITVGNGIGGAISSIFSGKTPDMDNYICMQSYGVASLSFQHKLKRVHWLGIGADISYSYCKYQRFKTGEITSAGSSQLFMMMFNLNFYYLQKRHIELYSGLTCGLGFLFDLDASNMALPACHLTAFALSAGGEHVRYHCELGVGTKGFVNMGIGYKF